MGFLCLERWSQWSTRRSGPLARQESGRFPSKSNKYPELVAHSVEWTTGVSRKWQISLKKSQMSRASGPLGGVDH